jgi:hypothetical protein
MGDAILVPLVPLPRYLRQVFLGHPVRVKAQRLGIEPEDPLKVGDPFGDILYSP